MVKFLFGSFVLKEEKHKSADCQKAYDPNPYRNGKDVKAPYPDPHAVDDLALCLIKVDHDGSPVDYF